MTGGKKAKLPCLHEQYYDGWLRMSMGCSENAHDTSQRWGVTEN